jgi:hypothetical protein
MEKRTEEAAAMAGKAHGKQAVHRLSLFDSVANGGAELFVFGKVSTIH